MHGNNGSVTGRRSYLSAELKRKLNGNLYETYCIREIRVQKKYSVLSVLSVFTTCSFPRHGITLGKLGSAHLAYENVQKTFGPDGCF